MFCMPGDCVSYVILATHKKKKKLRTSVLKDIDQNRVRQAQIQATDAARLVRRA